METIQPIHLLPTMPMLWESLAQDGWDCTPWIADENQQFREVRLYHRKQTLKKDILYLLRPEERDFPFDEYAYVSAGNLPGKANHMRCPCHPDEEILDRLLDIFDRFRNWEEEINGLLYRNASLQELCDLGTEILGNPVWIHDDWFVMMAMSGEFAQIMEPEYLMSSAKGFVPRAVVEDFQNDSEYLETYAHRGAKIWNAPEHDHVSLYVNLWEGSVYKGRLLVARKNRDFRKRDFLLAEALTQRALVLLQRKTLGSGEIHQDMDDIVFALLQGKAQDPLDLEHLLNMLNWQKQDKFLCFRVRSQQSGQNAMLQHALHSDMFRNFSEGYVLLDNQEQCVILNLSRCCWSVSEVRHRLAPLCRDYCLYAGVSSPVAGIRELQIAYCQAGIALDCTFRFRSEKWILHFSECVLEHLVQSVISPLTPEHLVSPDLIMLMEHDREQGTLYFETLRQYLLLERDIPKTAEKLIIHRTTLLYRLKKIAALLSVNLEDPWQRLHLILSLWILEKKE